MCDYKYIIYIDNDIIYVKDNNGNIKFKNTNITTVIQKVLNSLSIRRKWKEKVVLKGNFKVHTKIKLVSNLILDLRQSELDIINSFDNDILEIYEKDNIEILGGIIEGNKFNQSLGNILRIKTSSNITIAGTKFKNAKKFSIHISDSSNSTITQCIFNTCGDRNIVIDRSKYIKIIKNFMASNDSNTSILINAAGDDISNITIENNIIKDSFLYGILFDGTFSMYDCKISDNLVDTSGQSGICINSDNLIEGKSIKRFDISRNIILNAGSSIIGPSLDGILIGTSSNMKISGNNIYRPSADGISTLYTIRSVFSSNIIENAGFDSGAGQGILIRFGVSNIIFGNNIYLSGQDGIRLSGTSYSIVYGNTIIDSSQAENNIWSGISLVADGLTNSLSNIIRDNNILENERKSKYGISEGDKNQNYNEILGNTITGVIANTIYSQGPNTRVKCNQGFKTETNLISEPFAVDVVEIKNLKMPHGLQIIPPIQNCSLTVVTEVSDWAYDLLAITSANETDITVKIKISKSSSISDATARIAINVT